ncbi:hypothetical protein HY945_02890, partial [Candidatus Gottesmanbacteria bacterium]|nr:hypothetical protein [Candidatus Gottesmanbacteria bacterium]
MKTGLAKNLIKEEIKFLKNKILLNKKIYLAIGAIFLFSIFYFLFSIFKDLPTPAHLSYYEIPQTTKIFDRNGLPLYEIYT